MNPGADRGSAIDRASGARQDRTEAQPAENRSFEAPSWPSDSWDRGPRMRQRAIGWRGGRAH
ncbi:MAG TPA: hypothetical protein VGM25_03025 [Caulobacteraceae bacterium]|jgi:hypothetical protein